MSKRIINAYYWLRYNRLVRWYHHFIYGIKNLIAWFPIIWNDRPWDGDFLLKVMEFQLSMMIEDSKSWSHVGSEHATRQMMICRGAIRRILKDDFFEIRNAKLFSGPTSPIFKVHDRRMVGWMVILRKNLKYLREWWN